MRRDFFEEAALLADRLGLPDNLMLDPAQLGRVLGRGKSTVHHYRRNHPDYLPPALPGAYPRWYLPAVLAWMSDNSNNQSLDTPTVMPDPRRPGRPTKAEQVARREAAGGV